MGKFFCAEDDRLFDDSFSDAYDSAACFFDSPLGFIMAFLNASSSSLVRPPAIVVFFTATFASSRSRDAYLVGYYVVEF